MLGGKKPTKRPAWDLKGQLCDLNAELKCCRERTQTLNQENQQLQDQLKEAQQQSRALGAECRTLEGELARVQAQAEQGQQELGNLRARVLELEEQLGTQESLVQELQKEQLGLQEERRGLAARLEEQEVRATFLTKCQPSLLGYPEVSLGSESLATSLQQYSSLLLHLCPLLTVSCILPTFPYPVCFHSVPHPQSVSPSPPSPPLSISFLIKDPHGFFFSQFSLLLNSI